MKKTEIEKLLLIKQGVISDVKFRIEEELENCLKQASEQTFISELFVDAEICE